MASSVAAVLFRCFFRIGIVKSDFIKGAAKPDAWPKTSVPEFAFSGRSNAGKSSLINMFANRKSLVKTDTRPGMTRIINLFSINGGPLLSPIFPAMAMPSAWPPKMKPSTACLPSTPKQERTSKPFFS